MISKIIIGTWPLSGDYGKIDYKQIQDILEHCYELGIREFDTAPNYGNGVMEKHLGVILENKNGFDGDYIGGDTETIVFTDDVWKEHS